MDALALSRPLVVGWSLGADVALEYSAAHPGSLAGLVLVDGALPTSQHLIADPEALRHGLKSPVMRMARALMGLTLYRYAVPVDQFADLVLEVDRQRTNLADTFVRLDCPTRMVLATATGHGGGENAQRVNSIWREAGERFAIDHPDIPVTWIEGSHNLPFTHPAEIAAQIAAVTSRA